MEKTAQFHVRMPMTMHRKLMREAKRNGQTLNAEILKRLEMSFPTEGSFPERYLKAVEFQEMARTFFNEAAPKLIEEYARRVADKYKWEQQHPSEGKPEGNDNGQRDQTR